MANRTDEDVSGRNPLFYAILGAGCCDRKRWTPVSEREQVIPILMGSVGSTISNLLISSALRSLVKFSYDQYEFSWNCAKDSPIRSFERCLRTLHLMAPAITLDGEFLHAAYESKYFPIKSRNGSRSRSAISFSIIQSKN